MLDAADLYAVSHHIGMRKASPPLLLSARLPYLSTLSLTLPFSILSDCCDSALNLTAQSPPTLFPSCPHE